MKKVLQIVSVAALFGLSASASAWWGGGPWGGYPGGYGGYPGGYGGYPYGAPVVPQAPSAGESK